MMFLQWLSFLSSQFTQLVIVFNSHYVAPGVSFLGLFIFIIIIGLIFAFIGKIMFQYDNDRVSMYSENHSPIRKAKTQHRQYIDQQKQLQYQKNKRR